MSRLLGAGVVKILDAQSLINTAGYLDSDVGGAAQSTVFEVVFGAATSAGTIVIEGAHDKTYAGVWALLATIPWATGASRIFEASIVGCFIARRARISVAIVGGTVDVWCAVSG